MSWRVRDAAPEDAAACAAVYAPYVEGTAVSFELEPPGVEEVARRIRSAQERHAWLVLVGEDDEVAGYAYAGPWRTRPAYRFSCEVSAYVAQQRRGAGGGRALYAALLDRLAALGYRTVVAGMVEPNPGSRALHSAAGFEVVGTLREVGHKAGAWHDVTLFQRQLGRPPSA